MQVVFFLLDCGFQTYFMGQGTLWLKKKIKTAKIKKKIKRLLPPWITSHLKNKILGMILHAVIA